MSDMFADLVAANDSKSKQKPKGKPKGPDTAPRTRAPEWPSAVKPRLNFMPDRHRKVEYGRRAVRNGAMLVLASTMVVAGGALWAGGVASNLSSDLKTLTAESDAAGAYLQQNEPITRYYANYVDQRKAVSHRFNDEVSASRVFDELKNLGGSSVEVEDITYDLSDQTCNLADPFKEAERAGCVNVSGEASSPGALAGFVDKVNTGSALFTQAQVTEASTQGGRMKFTMRTGYTSEAESNRGHQFTPTEEELGKVVKDIPTRFVTEKEPANGQ